MTNTIDSILNWAVPILLLLIAFGFVYIKFLQPYVIPLFIKLGENLKGNEKNSLKKEIIYE